MGNNQILSIGNKLMPQNSEQDIVKRQEEAAGIMFADMLSMNQTQKNFTFDTSDEVISTAKADSSDGKNEKASEVYEKYQYKDKTIRTETTADKAAYTEDTVMEVEKFEEAVADVITEECHVSKEELEAAMEELGLTYLDLLDNSNLASLIGTLTGSENVSQLLCNEAFTNVLAQVNVLGTELLAETAMTPEELAELWNTLEQQTISEIELPELSDQTEMPETAEHAAEDGMVLPKEEVVEAVSEGEPEAAETVEDVEAAEETVRLEHADMAAQEEEHTGDDENLSDNDRKFSGNTEKTTAQPLHTQVNENAAVHQPQNMTFTEQLSSVETMQTLPPNVTVSDIMEQIAEHTKVLASVDTTKIEMQLNPENLGKLHVEITEHEGSVTAKFHAQNAVVKEALEMQITDLKMNLNQAGVKVDSVEVAIASHEFERNLEQDADSKKQQDDAAEQHTGRRSIDLNNLDELSGLMTEEETLVAKMMAEQGNRVNFTA